jgi:hypothetical protein
MNTTEATPTATPTTSRQAEPRRPLLAIAKAWKEQVDLQERILDVTRY